MSWNISAWQYWMQSKRKQRSFKEISEKMEIEDEKAPMAAMLDRSYERMSIADQ